MNSIFSEQCWDDQCSLDVLVALSSQCKEIQYTFMKFSHVLSTLPPSLTNWDNQCSFLPNNVESQLIYGQLALPKKLQSLQIIALIVIRSSYCFDFVSHFVHLLFIYDINIIMYQIFLLQLHGWLPTKWRDFKSWLENFKSLFSLWFLFAFASFGIETFHPMTLLRNALFLQLWKRLTNTSFTYQLNKVNSSQCILDPCLMVLSSYLV